jgi:phosphoglycerate dehydrogenase-like enzyme
MPHAIPSIVIASQWPASLNEQLGVRLRGRATIVAVQGGLDDPALREARVLLAAPEAAMPATRPDGWPFALDWIQLISSGTDHYPGWLLDGAPGRVRISTGKGTSALPMAEFALAAIFAHAKRFPELWIGDSSRWGFTSLDSVSGATLGIAGFGVLGQAVARHALAVGMKVIALRHRLAQSPVQGVELVATLQQLAAQSDHLVLLLPANASTHRIVDAPLLAAAKPGLHLINLGRGTLVDQEALLAALDGGHIARATLDVTDPEPLPARHPLYRHPKVRISPHTSVFSSATFDALVDRVVTNVARLASGGPLDGER